MNTQLPKSLTEEVQKVFADLPPTFYGHVEIHFKNGVPGFAKVIATHNFFETSGKNPTYEASTRK
jgi:hypothetical protein